MQQLHAPVALKLAAAWQSSSHRMLGSSRGQALTREAVQRMRRSSQNAESWFLQQSLERMGAASGAAADAAAAHPAPASVL